MKKNTNDVLNQYTTLKIIEEINNSKTYLDFLNQQINFYQLQLERLEQSKPLFFQKKKIASQKQKKDEWQTKINNTYLKIEEEIELIIKLQDSLDISEQNDL